jgi:hypothetical protein
MSSPGAETRGGEGRGGERGKRGVRRKRRNSKWEKSMRTAGELLSSETLPHFG